MTSLNKFSSLSGLSTKKWGPSAWNFLFSSIMGSYPPIININDFQHIKIKNEFKNLFSSLQYTMPCIFCRESYKKYWIELPIDDYMDSRINMMKWLYMIKDKVNKKLMLQENELFKIEKNKINAIYKKKDITREKYDKIIQKLKNKICITKKSIPFINVLNNFESIRAK